MMGPVVAAMANRPDAPLYRRPWPNDIYERVRADTFHIGGWYDIFTRCTLDQYSAMREVAERTGRRAPHLLIGPWTHSSFLGNTGQLDFGPAASGAVLDGRGGLNGEHLRWFAATLKGDETALADTPPVRLFVMGDNRWRAFDRYPVPDTRVEDWHLHPGGGLTRTAAPDSTPGPDSHRYSSPTEHTTRSSRSATAANSSRASERRAPLSTTSRCPARTTCGATPRRFPKSSPHTVTDVRRKDALTGMWSSTTRSSRSFRHCSRPVTTRSSCP